MIDQLVELTASRIPAELGFTREEVENYVKWHALHGKLVLCLENGQPVGVGYINRVKDLRDFDPFVEEEEGDFIYCAMAIGEKDMLPRLIEAAKIRFPGAKYLCFQRQHRSDDRMRVWRLKDEQQKATEN